MTAVSITAEAGLDIVRRIGSELKVDGILLREIPPGKIRYLLRAASEVAEYTDSLPDLPRFDALRAVMLPQQIVGIMTIAQNAALAATLRRIERTLESMECRLEGIELRLTKVDLKLDLVRSAMRNAPVARLKSAKNQAVNALRHADRTALIAAAQSAEQAAWDLLFQATDLARIEIDGLPVALRCPAELADLTRGTAEAMEIASAMHVALGSPAASRILEEAADALAGMRTKLRTALRDPELSYRRTNPELADTTNVVTAGSTLHHALHWMRGRAVMIGTGLISADPAAAEFETVREVDGIVFETVGHQADD
jgi:hypothetical protein